MIQTFNDFFDALFAIFPNTINHDNKAYYYDYYREALRNPRIDYDKLFRLISIKHKSQFAPPPAELKEWAKDALRPDKTNVSNECQYNITCVFEGGRIYEFQGQSCDIKNAEKLKSKALFWWEGNRNDCPKEYENEISKMIDDFKIRWMRGVV